MYFTVLNEIIRRQEELRDPFDASELTSVSTLAWCVENKDQAEDAVLKLRRRRAECAVEQFSKPV